MPACAAIARRNEDQARKPYTQIPVAWQARRHKFRNLPGISEEIGNWLKFRLYPRVFGVVLATWFKYQR